MRDDRPAQIRLLRNPRGHAVAPAAAAAASRRSARRARGRSIRPTQRLLAVDERDQRREQRDAAREADRPVDRVDHPARPLARCLPRRTPRRRCRARDRPRADGCGSPARPRGPLRSRASRRTWSRWPRTGSASRISRRARSAAWPAARAAASRSSERIRGRVESSRGRRQPRGRSHGQQTLARAARIRARTRASRSCTATTSGCVTRRTRARSRRSRHGPATCGSLMVPCPAFAEAAERARAHPGTRSGRAPHAQRRVAPLPLGAGGRARGGSLAARRRGLPAAHDRRRRSRAPSPSTSRSSCARRSSARSPPGST